MLTVYASTNGIPIPAIISIINNVLWEDAPLYIDRLNSGFGLEITRFGKIPIAKRANRENILAHDERNA